MITDSEAPPPTAEQAKETEIAGATAKAQELFDRAHKAIDEAEKINAIGAFVDPASTLAAIGQARRALNDAFFILSTTAWPQQRTYEREERQ